MTVNRVGPPVRGADFFGRDDIAKLLSRKLSSGHVLLLAPRRFGKTSLMYRVMEAPPPGYQVIHADLEHLTKPSELIVHLIEKLAKDSVFSRVVGGIAGLPSALWKGILDSVEEVDVLQAKITLRNYIEPNWHAFGDTLFRQISKSPAPLLLVLDELPVMLDRMSRSPALRPEGITLVKWLRRLRQEPGHSTLRFLLAGSIGLDRVLRDLNEMASFNDFERITLRPFSHTTAKKFLAALAVSSGIKLTPPQHDKMIELVGEPIPYFLQILHSEVEQASLLDAKELAIQDIERIYHDRVLGHDCRSYFEHYYSRLKDYFSPEDQRAAKRILRELAVSNGMTEQMLWHLYKDAHGGEPSTDEFKALLSDLQHDFYVVEQGNASFKFASKILRDWWLRHYGLNAAV